jgi:hypothetical protein
MRLIMDKILKVAALYRKRLLGLKKVAQSWKAWEKFIKDNIIEALETMSPPYSGQVPKSEDIRVEFIEPEYPEHSSGTWYIAEPYLEHEERRAVDDKLSQVLYDPDIPPYKIMFYGE